MLCHSMPVVVLKAPSSAQTRHGRQVDRAPVSVPSNVSSRSSRLHPEWPPDVAHPNPAGVGLRAAHTGDPPEAAQRSTDTRSARPRRIDPPSCAFGNAGGRPFALSAPCGFQPFGIRFSARLMVSFDAKCPAALRRQRRLPSRISKLPGAVPELTMFNVCVSVNPGSTLEVSNRLIRRQPSGRQREVQPNRAVRNNRDVELRRHVLSLRRLERLRPAARRQRVEAVATLGSSGVASVVADSPSGMFFTVAPFSP